MPYKNIVFVKLEKRLLNDPRWWTMSDNAQLIYIKLMLLAAETYNKMPLSDSILSQAIRTSSNSKEFQRAYNEIVLNFPKLKTGKHFRYFDEFETKTNWVNPKKLRGNSQVFPKVVVEKEIDKEKEKEKRDFKFSSKKPKPNHFEGCRCPKCQMVAA